VLSNKLHVCRLLKSTYWSTGRGALYILDHSQEAPADEALQAAREYQWIKDGIYDAAWSEISDNILWSCTGDGSILVYDLADSRQEPIQIVKAHEREVYSLHWNQV